MNKIMMGVMLVALICITMVAPAMAQPSTPFVINGYVCDSDSSPCNDPAVLVTNTNTSESWNADNDSASNYYNLVLNTDNVSAGDILRFKASGCTESTTVEHTVTQSYLEDGGIIGFNIVFDVPQEILWQGDVTLINGTTFDKIAHNSGVSYELNRTTALGALDAAAEEGIFNYTMNDEWYATWGSLFVDSIADIPSEGYNGWMYWVNYPEDPMPMVGADQFVPEDGDVVTWYWSSSMDTTPANSSMLVNINIAIEEPQEIIWQGDVTLINGTTFDKTAHNSGVSYEIDRTTALGALDAAAEKGIFNYTISDEYYLSWGSLFVDSIADIPNEGYNGWMYWVNYLEDPMPMVGADQFVLEDGDVVTWYWSSSMDMTPADSPMLVNVNVAVKPDLTTTYDFTTGAGIDKWAYRYQTDAKPPAATDTIPDIEFVTATKPNKDQYAMISTDNHKMQSDSTDANGNYAAHRFVFDISQSVGDILTIEVLWNGKGANKNRDVLQGATLYIRNCTSGAYEELANMTSNREAYLTGEATAEIGSYIDTTGNLTVLVEQNSAQTVIGKRSLVSKLSTDYVKVDITHT